MSSHDHVLINQILAVKKSLQRNTPEHRQCLLTLTEQFWSISGMMRYISSKQHTHTHHTHTHTHIASWVDGHRRVQPLHCPPMYSVGLWQKAQKSSVSLSPLFIAMHRGFIWICVIYLCVRVCVRMCVCERDRYCEDGSLSSMTQHQIMAKTTFEIEAIIA